MENSLLKDDFFSELVKFNNESDEKEKEFTIKNERIRLNQTEKVRFANVVSVFFNKSKVVTYFDGLFSISKTLNYEKKKRELNLLLFSNYVKAINISEEDDEKEEEKESFSNIRKLFQLRSKITVALNVFFAVKNISANWHYYYYKITRGDFDFLRELEKFDLFESMEGVTNSEGNIIENTMKLLALTIGNTIQNAKYDLYDFFANYIAKGTYAALATVGKVGGKYLAKKVLGGNKVLKALGPLEKTYTVATTIQDAFNVTTDAVKSAERTQNFIRNEGDKVKRYLREYSNTIHGKHNEDLANAFSLDFEEVEEETFAPKTNYKTTGENFNDYITNNLNSKDPKRKQIAEYLNYVSERAKKEKNSLFSLTASTELDYNINSFLNDFDINDISGLESLAGSKEKFYEMVLEMRSGISIFDTSVGRKIFENKTPLEQLETFKPFFNKRTDEKIYKNNEEGDYLFYGMYHSILTILEKKEKEYKDNIILSEMKKMPFKVEIIKDEKEYFQRNEFNNLKNERKLLQIKIKHLWTEILNNNDD